MSRAYRLNSTEQTLHLSPANVEVGNKNNTSLYFYIFRDGEAYVLPLRHGALTKLQSRDFVTQCAAIVGATVTFPDDTPTVPSDIEGDDYTKRA